MLRLPNYLRNVFLLILLSSCASTMLTNKNIQPNEIHNIGSFEAISMVRQIKKGNQAVYNDSLSRLSSQILDSIILHSESPKIVTKLDLSDDKLKNKVYKDILNTISEITNSKKLEGIKTTPILDSIIKSQNQRYALCVVNIGFERIKGNYGKQIAKGIGLGILTLGMYSESPIKESTSLYAMILDAEKSSVVFYNTIPMVVKSPTDKNNLNEQYKLLWNKYLYNNP